MDTMYGLPHTLSTLLSICAYIVQIFAGGVLVAAGVRLAGMVRAGASRYLRYATYGTFCIAAVLLLDPLLWLMVHLITWIMTRGSMWDVVSWVYVVGHLGGICLTLVLATGAVLMAMGFRNAPASGEY